MIAAPPIFVLSDATGNTAEKVVRAALVQFGARPAVLRIWPRMRTQEEVSQVVAQAAHADALLVHTLVNAGLRSHVEALCTHMGVRSFDLIGPLLSALSSFLELAPDETPGAQFVLDETYFRRIEAMEFSVKADDGQSPRLLDNADIVLVGVSRTSKTPVSTHLASQGYKVANVPLVMGAEPPAELFELPPGRVFALTIDPVQLSRIRERRLAQLGVTSEGEYADEEHVFDEVRWALRLFRRRGHWPIIDVTELAVEETASEILKRKAQLELEYGP